MAAGAEVVDSVYITDYPDITTTEQHTIDIDLSPEQLEADSFLKLLV